MTKRITIFAHFDKDNVIDDYVIFYLKELKKVSEKIIFVSACDLATDEKNKLDGICEVVIAQNHKEYDFGSYKRGFHYFIENSFDCDEIIFANDSCYGPLYLLKEVFEKTGNELCDFWGISENPYDVKGKTCPHIQSYFFVIKKNIFTTSDFINFMENIHSEEKKNDIVQKYEVGLSKMLLNKGFKSSSYIKRYKEYGNPTIFAWRELLEERLSPLVKCSLFRLQNTRETTVFDWETYLKQYDYNIDLIKNNLKRLKIRSIKNNVLPDTKLKYFNFYRNTSVPKFVRKYTNIFMKHFYSKIFD